MQKDIRRSLNEDPGHDVFFTSMIDLYALHHGFPGVAEAQKFTPEPYRRVEFLERSWAAETNDCRFIPHIQLHEYEADLFADISILIKYYPDEQTAIKTLKKNKEHFGTPELIDDGPDTAPSRRIIEHVPRYASDKSTVGVQAVERIKLATIRSRCPHFSRWLKRLEGLGSKASKS